MEDLPLGIIAALVPEFAVKDLPLGRTLIMMMITITVVRLLFSELQIAALRVCIIQPITDYQNLVPLFTSGSFFE